MENNVYEAPESDVSVDESVAVIQIYSPTQVACGAFVGGPVGLIYFLMSNFDSLGKYTAKNKVFYAGIALLIILTAVFIVLPENFPSFPFTVGYIVAARYIADNHQLKKNEIDESDKYDFQSGWKVFGISLLCALGSILLIGGPLVALAMLGVTE